MAGTKVSIPDQMQDWMETRVRSGEYADVSDYVGDLIRLDRERHEALVQALIEGEKSGISERTVSQIIAQAKARARTVAG